MGSQNNTDELRPLLSLAAKDPNDFVTVADLAQMVGRCTRTVYRYYRPPHPTMRAQLPPPVAILGRRGWRVRTLLDHFSELEREASRKAG